jgi:predicted transcriptional regulator
MKWTLFLGSIDIYQQEGIEKESTETIFFGNERLNYGDSLQEYYKEDSLKIGRVVY